MRRKIYLPRFTKLIWKHITKVFSSHHKQLGRNISVDYFIQPIIIRLEDALASLQQQDTETVELSIGIIGLSLDYLFYIGAQLHGALPEEQENEKIHQVFRRAGVAICMVDALSCTYSGLTKKIQGTVQRITKSMDVKNHIGRFMFSSACKNGRFSFILLILRHTLNAEKRKGESVTIELFGEFYLAIESSNEERLDKLWDGGFCAGVREFTKEMMEYYCSVEALHVRVFEVILRIHTTRHPIGNQSTFMFATIIFE